MQDIFFTADSHFGHANVIRHCDRPWVALEEHDEALTNLWNAFVPKKALVYHLGDFAMFGKQEDGTPRMKLYRRTRMRLNGKIILVSGNHDQMSADTLSCFSEVHNLLDRKINGYHFTLCHYPLLAWNRSVHNFKHPNDLKKCSIMLHGHCHNRLYRDNPYRLDVGVDGWDYTPVHIDEIIKNVEEFKLTHASERIN